MRIPVALTLLLSLSACPTSFTGNAFVADGRSGCEHKCKKAKLRMSALVYLGEYSSACVCEVPLPADAGVAPAAPSDVDAGVPPAADPLPAASGSPSTGGPSAGAAAAASLGGVVGAAINQPADPDRPASIRW